jgi:hypothetical protein
MLFSVGSTRRTKERRVGQGRRVNVQLELFPTREEPPPKPQVWKRLTREERRTVTAILARVMTRAARLDARRDSEEDEQ